VERERKVIAMRKQEDVEKARKRGECGIVANDERC